MQLSSKCGIVWSETSAIYRFDVDIYFFWRKVLSGFVRDRFSKKVNSWLWNINRSIKKNRTQTENIILYSVLSSLSRTNRWRHKIDILPNVCMYYGPFFLFSNQYLHSFFSFIPSSTTGCPTGNDSRTVWTHRI